MSLPYESSTSGDKALGEIKKILQGFGCGSFGSMMDFSAGELLVQFEYRGHKVSVKASAKGYAAAWLKQNPYTNRTRATKQQHEKRALDIGGTAIYSMVRDWIKGQLTAVETGILTFEGAFLGQLLLQNGQTVLEKVEETQMLKLTDSRQ